MPAKKKSKLILDLPPMSKFGTFSGVSYITTGETPETTDTFIKEEQIPSRYLGKNMMAGPVKKGNLPSVYFGGSYATLASAEQNKGNGDTYDDNAKANAERLKAMKAKQEKIHKGKDFKLASYPKKGTGAGSYVGTFQDKPFPHDVEIKPSKKKPKPPVEPKVFGGGKNLYTNPGKKGTYGTIGQTFGGFSSLYVVTEAMEAQRKKDIARYEKEQAKRDAANKKLMERPVFRTMVGNGKKTFDEKNGTGISSVYDDYTAPEPKKKPRKRKNKKEPKLLELPPFKYSSPPKVGENGFFNGFANKQFEINEEEEEKKRKKKERAERRKNRGKKKIKSIEHPTWKPVSYPKAGTSSSLLTRYY